MRNEEHATERGRGAVWPLPRHGLARRRRLRGGPERLKAPYQEGESIDCGTPVTTSLARSRFRAWIGAPGLVVRPAARGGGNFSG
jgi:hypothetical protein